MTRSGRWSFLLQPRWIAGHVIVIVLTLTFAALGFWQLDRNDEKHDLDDAAKAAYAAPAPDLPPAGAEPSSGTRVQATGAYDGDAEVLLRNRVRDGEGGYDVLTALVLDDGTAIVVDRGWVARNRVDNARDDLAPPTGTVTVRGPLAAPRSLTADDTVDERDGRLTLPRVDLDRIEAETGLELRDVYLVAQYQDPAPADGTPSLPTPPPSSDVNHLQYALQWFAFALIPIVGWPIVLWRVSRRPPRKDAPPPDGAALPRSRAPAILGPDEGD
jgi:surfeit locus 1 family protein